MVVISRLLYAASAWWGFTTALQQPTVNAYRCCRGLRAVFCDEDMPVVSAVVKYADDALFERTMRDNHHVL